jgi:uncharacterized membrane protein YedE/YeeE
MNAPLSEYGYFGIQAGYVLAFLIGIGFGFFLERAGFGSSRKLAAVFYLTDFTVLKVMFTAIVTAMLGAILFSKLGILDLSLVYVSPTFVVPFLVGGLLFGVGFVTGGYCPGTALVALASGSIDAAVFLVGMMGGVLVWSFGYPLWDGFAHSTAMGRTMLYDVLPLSPGVVALLVALMAVGAFLGAEKLERIFGAKAPASGETR